MPRAAASPGRAGPPGIHARVAAQAVATPEATALCYRDERMSYRELDSRAARLAPRLTAAGLTPGSVAGVHLERSTGMAVALLAVLKTGAGYAMLDPDFPADRLRAMVADARCPVIVTRRDRWDRRLGGTARPVYLDDPADPAGPADPGATDPGATDPDPAGPAHPADPAVPVDPDAVACVMFTSGSTGRPKGIVATHRAVVDTLTGQDYASFGPGAVWLQCSPVSWDAFALELWGPLLAGGTSVLHPGPRPDPVVIADLVAAHGVTSLFVSGSLFNVVVDEYPAALAGLRELITGGEVLSPVHLARARQLRPELRLSQAYGPVEAMIFLTIHPLRPEDLAGGPVPIGRPLAGKRVHLLDRRLRPVADGEVGEVYAAGAGLARGYADRPGPTAERFVADPYGSPGGRMYRTGDLARRRPDGVLEFAGRADAQLKVRGFRVEPGEVEAVLAGHPGIERAAVAADRDRDGDLRLVAYVVARDGRTPPAEEVRAHAAAALPDFMVPAEVVPVAALPLTATGKLDRAALPPAAADPVAHSPGADDPRPADVAGRLTALFAEVLGVPSVDPDDDFFARGGDSLRAARLRARIREDLGAEVGIRALFASPTVSRLVPRLTAADPPQEEAPAADEPVPAAQARLWYLDHIAGDRAATAYQQAVLVRLPDPVDPETLARALDAVAARYPSLRTGWADRGGEPAPVLHTGPTGRPAPLAGDPARAAAALAETRFALATEPPVRAALAPADGGTQALALVVHGIAADEWSLPHLLTALAAALTTTPDDPPPSRLPGGNRHESASIAASASITGYWERVLGDHPSYRPLPRPPGAPDVPGPGVARAVRELAAEVHSRLATLAGPDDTDLLPVLHAALVAALARSGAGDDTVVLAETRPPDGPVGCLTHPLVLRVDAGGDPTLAALRDRVREADREAYDHRGVPFEWVLRRLNPVRSPGRLPFTDVALAVRPDLPALDLPGGTARVERIGPGAARYPLLVEAVPRYRRDGAPDGLELTVAYATDAFAAPVAEWLADAVVAMLAALAGAAGDRLSTVSLPELPGRPAGAQATPAPAGRTDLSGRIAAIWSDVLGVAEVGPDDDFFALGGNSLKAVRVAARLTTAEGRQVTAATVFAAPTVADLAREVATAPDQPPPIPRRPRTLAPPATAAPAAPGVAG